MCFYITSLAAESAFLAQAICSHWGIENSLHWVLDVTFKEDHIRIRRGHGPENMGLLRRLSVNLLKREPSKQSIKYLCRNIYRLGDSIGSMSLY